MLEKDSLFLAVVRETRLAIVASYRQNYLRARRQSSNVVNIISSEITHYKATDATLTREALQHKSRDLTLMIKSISVEATADSRLDKCQVQKT